MLIIIQHDPPILCLERFTTKFLNVVLLIENIVNEGRIWKLAFSGVGNDVCVCSINELAD